MCLNVKTKHSFSSLCTTLSLQWEPEIIAVALMYLAGKLSKFEVVDWIGRHQRHLRWWDMFVEDVTMDLLEGKNIQNKIVLVFYKMFFLNITEIDSNILYF